MSLYDAGMAVPFIPGGMMTAGGAFPPLLVAAELPVMLLLLPKVLLLLLPLGFILPLTLLLPLPTPDRVAIDGPLPVALFDEEDDDDAPVAAVDDDEALLPPLAEDTPAVE